MMRVANGKNWKVEKFNPLDFIRANVTPEDFNLVKTFVKFNPEADFQYRRREQSAHDGTLMFEHELLARTVNPILSRDSWFTPDTPPPGSVVTGLQYEVGWLWLFTVFGRVSVPAGAIFGQKSRTCMRVRAKFTYSGGDAALPAKEV